MECSSLKKVNKFYGSEVKQYCKNNNVLFKRDKRGGLKINKIDDLLVCEKIIQSKEFNKEFYERYLLKPDCRRFESCKTKSENKNETRNILLQIELKNNNNFFLEKVNPKIILHDNTSRISVKSFSKKCILDRAMTGIKIYKNLLNTKIQLSESKMYNDLNFPCNQQLIFILELLQENHKRNNYKGMLNKILDKNDTNKCKISREILQKPWQNIDKYEIIPQQLNIFFTQILIKVVPIQLFGCFKNREIITKIVCCILKSARFQPIYLKSYISRLNIEKIVWLKCFEDEFVKCIIVVKLVKWLLAKYIIQILYKYIHVTVHPSAIGKRLYFQHYLWCRMKRSFIKRNKYLKIFQPLSEKMKWNLSNSEYKLLLKNSGLRPVVKERYTEEAENEKILLLKFLRQLCVTHYGFTSPAKFYSKWKRIVHYSRTRCKKIWLVSCDLDDAYGSILLDQLSSIIEILCKDLPEILQLKWIGSLHFNQQTTEIIYEKYFVDLDLIIPSGRMYAPVSDMSNMCSCYIMKKTLLEYIKMSIYYQKVQVKKTEYRVSKGILQGTMLSNVLSEIYYSYIFDKRLSRFTKSGKLFRYVDDILYVTKHMESATAFMKTIKKGFNKYNCKFKQSKIQTNLPCRNNYAKDKIRYLGCEIDCDSLETLPYFQEVHPSFLFTLILNDQKRYHSIMLFKRKLFNCAHLRLSRVILMDSTHLVEHLILFVKKIATIQAWRTRLLIGKIFGDAYINNAIIFEIIVRSNEKIVKILLNHCTEGILKDANITKEEIKKEIFISLWTGYKQVFSSDNALRNAFIARILNTIKCFRE